MEFKDRLKRCMDFRSINGMQLANKTGISRSSICLYLKGERLPKTEQIYRIALALDVDALYLLGLSDSMIKQEFKVHQHITGEQSEEELLLAEIRSNITFLNIDEMKIVNKFIKTLIEGRKRA